jgi:acylphosphatase
MKESVESAGYTLDSVLKKNKRLYLKKISNISAGGDPIDVTDELSSELKDIAIQATRSVPGLEHAGVDMIINNTDNSAVILELNTKPGIGSHIFPVEGEARDIPKHLIDHYFPETKGIQVVNKNILFNFGDILDSLKGMTISEVEVVPHSGKLKIQKKYTVTGDFELIDYHRLQRIALDQNINGYVKKVDLNTIEIVMSSANKMEMNDLKNMIYKKKYKAFILNIEEEDWKYPIELGFSVRNGSHTMSIRELEDQLKEKKKELDSIMKEQKRLSHRIKLVQQSRTWRLSSLIRSLLDV